MAKIVLTSQLEYEEYVNKFINKWKPIFDNSLNKNKTFRLNSMEFFSDFEPISDYAMVQYFSQKIDRFMDIKELKNNE